MLSSRLPSSRVFEQFPVFLIFLSCRWFSHYAAKSASSSVPKKTVHIVLPPVFEYEKPVTMTISFVSSQEFDRFCSSQHFLLRNPDNNAVAYRFDELVSGQVYLACGAAINFARNQQETHRIDSLVLELKAAWAVSHALGANATFHSNIKFELDGKNREYDAIVLHKCEKTKELTAFIVESARSPQPGEVKLLLEKVDVFKKWAASSDRYKAVTKFVPVLGGRIFPDTTIRECIAHNISRVAPTGSDFEWIRDERK
jgi:hypothetical protein